MRMTPQVHTRSKESQSYYTQRKFQLIAYSIFIMNYNLSSLLCQGRVTLILLMSTMIKNVKNLLDPDSDPDYHPII